MPQQPGEYRAPNSTLVRRKPLTSKAALSTAVPLARGQGLKSESKRKAKERRDPTRAEIRAAVYRRDGGCIMRRLDWHSCFGELTPHHLDKDGQGGGYTEANLVAVCSFGNDTWIEGNPIHAHDLGLVRWRGDTMLEVWQRLLAAGLVPYIPIHVTECS